MSVLCAGTVVQVLRCCEGVACACIKRWHPIQCTCWQKPLVSIYSIPGDSPAGLLADLLTLTCRNYFVAVQLGLHALMLCHTMLFHAITTGAIAYTTNPTPALLLPQMKQLTPILLIVLFVFPLSIIVYLSNSNASYY